MVKIDDVKDAARALWNSVTIPTSLKEPGKIYEAWLMLELAATLQAEGIVPRIAWRDGTGNPPSMAIFRGAPAPLMSPPSSGQPGFVLFECGREFYELHNSVQYEGASGALHEIDISVISHRRAKYLRSIGIGFPSGLPLFGAELKYYQNASFSIGIVRQFSMLSIDLALHTAPRKGPPTVYYYESKGKLVRGTLDHSLLYILTSATSTSQNSHTLANYYRSEIIEDFDVDPQAATGSDQRLVEIAHMLWRYL